MTIDSLELTIPKENLWPNTNNSYWDFHTGNPRGVFRSLRFFDPPLNARYGTPTNLVSYNKFAQLSVYESHRAMFEAYSRNKYDSTGVIQWMLNNAFPSNIWHLYDFYLNPGASYFATKISCEPLHIMYTYLDNTIWVVNSLYDPFSNVIAQIEVNYCGFLFYFLYI
jgi:exo-1,4-beta-D-glucosaminidase